jgi:hypothetical protein
LRTAKETKRQTCTFIGGGVKRAVYSHDIPAGSCTRLSPSHNSHLEHLESTRPHTHTAHSPTHSPRALFPHMTISRSHTRADRWHYDKRTGPTGSKTHPRRTAKLVAALFFCFTVLTHTARRRPREVPSQGPHFLRVWMSPQLCDAAPVSSRGHPPVRGVSSAP